MEGCCISCGMPMNEKEDFPLGDITKNYCVHCSNKEGDLRPYTEVLENMAKFLNENQGIPLYEARHKAKDHLDKMPAWRPPESPNVKNK